MKRPLTKRPFGGRRRHRFLEILAECGNVTLAAQAAGVARCVPYAHRQLDDSFAKAWEEAEQVAADRLEAEAWRRAVEGVPEPLVSAGKLVRDEDGQPLVIQRYSDQLLTLLLRAHRPDKFRDRAAVEIDISDRLAERLEAARRRALANPEPPATLELKADEVRE
jgi:hypothetical protein